MPKHGKVNLYLADERKTGKCIRELQAVKLAPDAKTCCML